MSATTLDHERAAAKSRMTAIAPWLLLGTLTAAIVALLVLPLRMPIGAMYWDTFIYLDAAHRIAIGQVPNIDFLTPVGPLGYYLFALFQQLFPTAQPVLVASWSIALVTIPAMAMVTADLARRSPVMALAVALPFAIFTLLPFNTTEYFVFPGADGFGIYNRQASQLLYVITTALMFVRDQRLLAALTGLLMLALFLVKITAFGAAGLICMVALAAGRVRLSAAIAAGAIFVLALGVIELTTGIVSAYIDDIRALLAINQENLVVRLVQGASRTGGTVIFTGLLALALMAWLPPRAGNDQPLWRALADHPVAWIGAALAGGVIYESQNTGSQELIHLWPVVIGACATTIGARRRDGRTAVIFLFAAAAVLPPLVHTIQHASRATLAMVRQDPLVHDHLGSIGQVTVRPRWLERYERMRAHYIAWPEATRAIAERRELPGYSLFSEHDFQIGQLRNADDAASALKAMQARGLEFDTVMTLDFANLFPWLLNAGAPRHIAIGADPFRAVPAIDNDVRAAVADTDLVLEPQCPYTDNVRQLGEIYAPALAAHTKVRLTDCYQVYVHPRLADRFTS